MWLALAVLAVLRAAGAQVLNPPYFNLAEGRHVWASATCGDPEPELFCKLVGANVQGQDHPNINLIQGQFCDHCNASDPARAHPPAYAIDGTERWWQSPPLSRGNRFNEVNLTIDLGQEFHVAYVFIKMGNSPRPKVWVLERSTDNGTTYKPWQYFADNPNDCIQYFGQESVHPILSDNSVTCEDKFSKVVPLEGGEIVVSLLNKRPSADNFTYSAILQEWTKATNIRLRFLKTKTLLGHLMSVARQDPTVTRRYFYSIKDINIGGRCVCNGHADTCDLTDPLNPYKLLCRCQHNTCGAQCEQCCPGFVQKRWSPAKVEHPFECEACNCFGHSEECTYDKEVDTKHLSLDLSGQFLGGGVCQNCRHNTMGINCNQCKPGFYHPHGRPLDVPDVCAPCQCDLKFSTGNCAELTGQCQCRPQYQPPLCDKCNVGYYGYPTCQPCVCNYNGTVGPVCNVDGGQCPCKPNFQGHQCNQCAPGYYNFPHCLPCDCKQPGSLNPVCESTNGQCECRDNYNGRRCETCAVGYYNYPKCDFCACDPDGTTEEVCHNVTGTCICKPGFGGPKCGQCVNGYFGFPNCRECGCNRQGSNGQFCDHTGRCRCLSNFAGMKCDQCSSGHYKYPQCHACNCGPVGAVGRSCNEDGICRCRPNFDGDKCTVCKENFYNYPRCEECNCNPAGVLPTFGGCGSLTSGELCECKERVIGRICDQCIPLYWNLRSGNHLGCEECDCHKPGIINGVGLCDGTSGQCLCKPNVISRRCETCRDGTYRLEEDNLFGCQNCHCAIGGSITSVCDKASGQCVCKPRITGLNCDRPLQMHYFPNLFQHKFEIEDGRTPEGAEIRFDFDESIFPGFSWKGYATFPERYQKEIILDVWIEKQSLYHAIFHYLNPGTEPITASLSFIPESTHDSQQSCDVVFPPTSQPQLLKVSTKQGLEPFHFVLEPGRWVALIHVDKSVLLDYLVLLPQAFYEATILQEVVETPCQLSNHAMCRHYVYPRLPLDSPQTMEVPDSVQLYSDQDVLQDLEVEPMIWLNPEQTEVEFDMEGIVPGQRYIPVVLYHTPEGGVKTNIKMEVFSSTIADDEEVILPLTSAEMIAYDCSYTFLCRAVGTDHRGDLATVHADSDRLKIHLSTESSIVFLAVARVVLVPEEQWHLGYLTPQPKCVHKDGECIASFFQPVPDGTRVEFENGVAGAERAVNSIPEFTLQEPTSTVLVPLSNEDATIDLPGVVPEAGTYFLVIHYYQPHEPRLRVKGLIQNGQFYEVEVDFTHCPSTAGCRVVVQNKGTDNTAFNILENFVLGLNLPQSSGNGTIWLDYLLAIPAHQFKDVYLKPLPQDRAGLFVLECGQDYFRIGPNVQGFCREAAFSLSAEYNNGAVQCNCDFEGSLSFECAEYGGQCQCKDNVIGRQCTQCQMGYYGFPRCTACNCPSGATCHALTGDCICPARVTGRACDTCIPYTFGFDSVVGCEACNCNPQGVLRNNLQCDLLSGQCSCKSNIVGRKCDRCKPGYYAFPHCQLCNCDLRGTTEDICDQTSSTCFCKENVYGESCDQCKPGTFHLEESNPFGCTKCFCFGATDRCTSAYHFIVQIVEMDGWNGVLLTSHFEHFTPTQDLQVQSFAGSLHVVLPDDLPTGSLFYFSAPDSYLGNRVTSYGGDLAYTLLTSVDPEVAAGNLVGPDVILMGNNLTLVHYNLEQPAGGLSLEVRFSLVEQEFTHLTTGREVSREQLMMVLVGLSHIYIRGSYFHPASDIRISHVILDMIEEGYVADAPRALRVEQCHCPPNYRGTSCEECAPGYYRAKTGPYLGYCVPCQCHGHTDVCDVETGKCVGCRHNTVGDHCEMCGPGYHGDATLGTPYDCLICACPLPIESNNFANSCEVSPNGLEISCQCQPEYYGARCEVCSAGFYGRPEIPGEYCKPCECSGNIDSENPASCDSVTGECVICLNNTFGSACEICAPGFFGDAVSLKDCKKCPCESCGTRVCSHYDGGCECWPNVVGENCDECAPDHWGFMSCRGCLDCNCGPAAIHTQCDRDSGQCECQPGATGITCDMCLPGYWQYSSSGCVSCNCEEKYSAGVGCDPLIGVCQCLPGVLGDKCDSCPHRWAFVKDVGCHECGPCVHSLLDDTDSIEASLRPTLDEMSVISASYLANQKLQQVNQTADKLRPLLKLLDHTEGGLDISGHVLQVSQMKAEADQHGSDGEALVLRAETEASSADTCRQDAILVTQTIQDTIMTSRKFLEELKELAEGLVSTAGPNIERLLEESKYFLELIETKNFTADQTKAQDELEEAKALLEVLEEHQELLSTNQEFLTNLNERKLLELLNELNEYNREAYERSVEAQKINLRLHGNSVKDVTMKIKDFADVTRNHLADANNNVTQAEALLAESHATLQRLDSEKLKRANNNLQENLYSIRGDLEELDPLVKKAQKHASELMERAQHLESLLSDTRESSVAAVKAATAYDNIVSGIEDARNASDSALDAANDADRMSNGITEKATNSEVESRTLKEEAMSQFDHVKEELFPEMTSAKEKVEKVQQSVGDSKQELDIIEKTLTGLTKTREENTRQAGLEEAKAQSVDSKVDAARDVLVDIAEQLESKVEQARGVPRAAEDARQSNRESQSYLERINSYLDTSDRITRVEQKSRNLRNTENDVSAKLAELRRKVALARDKANQIKLCTHFFEENSSLQLRNPAQMSNAATFTQLSLYFNTSEQHGLLAYVGNEEGTASRLKNVKTDDFMALEIRGGRVVFSMDLGSGPLEVQHERIVSDNKWHQALVERTGKTVSLTVRSKEEDDAVEERYSPGTLSVFNLDQRLSKFYVGGVPDSAQIQSTVRNRHYLGLIEDVEFNKSPVGLWNFVAATQNRTGCTERDFLVNLQPTNGQRFKGRGYTILPKQRHNFRQETVFSIKFKTFAAEGLLFLVGSQYDFLAVSLREGRMVLRYELGGGPIELVSSNQYNNGEWHFLDVSRERADALVKVDGEEVAQHSVTDGQQLVDLDTTDLIYIGGYPKTHHYSGVTNVDFEGCLKDLQIGSDLQDLNKNVESLNVVSGCPPQVARVVSFVNGTAGYLAMPVGEEENEELRLEQLTFKFKTAEEDGLLFYVGSTDHSKYVSLSLERGELVLRAEPGGELRTGSHYNDSEWHYVTATISGRTLQLDIDDLVVAKIDTAENLGFQTSSPLYFGGVPSNLPIPDSAAHVRFFSGCVGDTTVNSRFQNFAQSQDHPGASLSSCPLTERGWQPLEPTDSPSPPIHFLTPRPTAAGITTTTTSEPQDPSQCALPLEPKREEPTPPLNLSHGMWMGTSNHSRLEFLLTDDQTTALLDNSHFSLHFRTLPDSLTGGLLLYVTAHSHIDFEALLIKDGLVYYRFNCGTGTASIVTENLYNDGEWHKVEVWRAGKEGRMVLDGLETVRGSSPGTATSVNVNSPLYVGGLSTDFFTPTFKNNVMNVFWSFAGCIRTVKFIDTELDTPEEAYEVTPCTSDMEEGAFFTQDGGYLNLKNQFKVGARMSLSMAVRPRRSSGVLMAVHGGTDFVILQMVDNAVYWTVDNGKGPSTVSLPGQSLCDGNWHTIKAIKEKNTLVLGVDQISNFTFDNNPTAYMTNTNDPLYIGGIPPGTTQGVRTTESFVGCLTNVTLREKPQPLIHSQRVGRVLLNGCPTN